MIQSSVEKEIVIEAPVDVVWHLLTEPGEMRQWLAAETELDLRDGGAGAITFESGNSFQLQVEAVEPPHRFDFRWVRSPGLTLRDDNTLLVEFFLEPQKGGTRLRVVESGFDAIDWSDEEQARTAENHSDGWERCLARLRGLAANS